MTHNHDPIVQNDGIIKCRTCGEILPCMTETIATTDSAIKANRVLQEIAVAGQYQALSFEQGFVLYARTRNTNREELCVEKVSPRRYRVCKKTIHTGGGQMI